MINVIHLQQQLIMRANSNLRLMENNYPALSPFLLLKWIAHQTPLIAVSNT